MQHYNPNDDNHCFSLVAPVRFEDICIARDASLEMMKDAANQLAKAYEAANAAFDMAKAAHGGWKSPRRETKDENAIAELRAGYFDPAASVESFRLELDAAIWTRLIDETGIAKIMDRTEASRFKEQLLTDIPPVHLDTIYATTQTLMQNAEHIWERGIARVFSDLDRRFKSHDGFKIGSRIILRYVFDDYGSFRYDNYIRETLSDIERIFCILDGAPDLAGELTQAVIDDRRKTFKPAQTVTKSTYFTLKAFKNGHAHLWFNRDDLLGRVNKILAKFYGEVLGDAAANDQRPQDYRTTSTQVTRDLSFYPTPTAAVSALLDQSSVRPGMRVLEPQAGIGNIVRPLLAAGAMVEAVEIHPGRANTLAGIADKNLTVHCRNFLTMPPAAIYDRIYSNPPFAKTHYMQHVRHAFDFLAPGGVMRVILPATAELGSSHAHVRFQAWADAFAPQYGRQWESLPQESFAEVGTRINTVILTIQKPL